MIESLGGQIHPDMHFNSDITHLIVGGEPTRGEKFLAACATGKWVLKPSYLFASMAAGAFVDELDHEWVPEEFDSSGKPANQLAAAPRRWRLRCDSQRAQVSEFVD